MNRILSLLASLSVIAVAGCTESEKKAPAGSAEQAPATVTIIAEYACSAVGAAPGFTREIKLESDGKTLTYKNGDFANRQAGFETWTGPINGTSVTLSGEYKDGSNPAPVNLSGKIEKSIVDLSGKRGSRDCTVKTKA